ncbi:MAG: amidase [Reyranellaceae bacterium]
MAGTATELWRLTARQAVDLLRRGKVSPAELIDASETRVAATDGALNAMPTLCFDRARARIGGLERLDKAHPGWLGGLPIGVKDLNDVEGVKTTFGSPIYKDNISTKTDLGVRNLEARGALVVGKTNTPEFGAGAQTFNEVFGVTRNPWDTRMTCAGSSGGAAVALATGQVWLATGSDLGGSLRNPASFCSVVGFRPSPGRVPSGPSAIPLEPFPINGPMARNVGDVALMLDAYVGVQGGDPLSIEPPAVPFQRAVEAPVRPTKVAWSLDLGQCPVDREIAAVCEAAARRIAELGCTVDSAHPDATGAREAFQTMRAHNMATARAGLLKAHRDLLKPEVIWNIEAGLKLSIDDVRRGVHLQRELYQRFAAFFEQWDILVTPASQHPPFPVEKRYVEEINGIRMETYVDWLLLPSIITMTGLPCVSIPCGFTRSGLPIGLQLIGPPRGEARLLSAAHLVEELLGYAPSVPIDPIIKH